MSRGNERQNIVVTDEDRTLFLNTVGEVSERFEIDIYAYVLMDIIICSFVPIEQTCAGACSGLAPPTRKDTTCAKIEAAIYSGRYKNRLVQNDAYLK